jgi:hypothetical protein
MDLPLERLEIGRAGTIMVQRLTTRPLGEGDARNQS